MRTNISNNIISNTYYIYAKKPIYIDYTSDIFIKKYGLDCYNLELISNTFTNNELYDLELTDTLSINNNILFNSKYTLQHRITPNNYYNTGYWKTKTNNCNLSKFYKKCYKAIIIEKFSYFKEKFFVLKIKTNIF